MTETATDYTDRPAVAMPERSEPTVTVSRSRLVSLMRAAGLLDGLSESEVGSYVDNYLNQMG